MIKTKAATKEYRDGWDRVFAEKSNDLISWPVNEPARYNACTDPCDMWTGPCACGAWHYNGK